MFAAFWNKFMIQYRMELIHFKHTLNWNVFISNFLNQKTFSLETILGLVVVTFSFVEQRIQTLSSNLACSRTTQHFHYYPLQFSPDTKHILQIFMFKNRCSAWVFLQRFPPNTTYTTRLFHWQLFELKETQVQDKLSFKTNKFSKNINFT